MMPSFGISKFYSSNTISFLVIRSFVGIRRVKMCSSITLETVSATSFFPYMGVTKSVLLDHRVSECNEILTGWSQAKIKRIVTGIFIKNNFYAFYHHNCKHIFAQISLFLEKAM